jgi:ubiquinone/menaquinone biosynthesis C-methylase UbiE
MGRLLSHREARAFYDRFGSKQDLQRFYEDPALEVLEAHADLEHARAIVELGCGTGRLARGLFERRLGPEATYVGLDVSETMVELARRNVARWGDRARVQQTDGSPVVPVGDAGCDRFLSTYVLDLLSPADIGAVLGEAHRVLVPEGRLCLAGLTVGEGVLPRAVGRLWTAIHSLGPRLVGGCRPIRLLDHLADPWQILHREVVCTFGLCTEVVVARPRDQASEG